MLLRFNSQTHAITLHSELLKLGYYASIITPSGGKSGCALAVQIEDSAYAVAINLIKTLRLASFKGVGG